MLAQRAMGIACLQLANSFCGTPDSEKYRQRSLAAFKQAARMGSKSAIGQLAHLGVKWDYPRCTACGNCADPETDIEILVTCKCGVEVSVNRSSVDKASGATVVHDTFAYSSTAHGPMWHRCKYATYVPPAVWCPECRVNLVAEWEALLVSGTSDEVEATKRKHHPDPQAFVKNKESMASVHEVAQRENSEAWSKAKGLLRKTEEWHRNRKKWWQFWR